MIEDKTKEQILLDEYSESRQKVKQYIVELEELKDGVKDIFPKEMSYRNKFLMEEKLKTMSHFFDSLLKMRQEVHKTLKEEIDMRRKFAGDDNVTSEEDVRQIAMQMDEIRRQERKKQKEADEQNEEQNIKLVK